MLRELLLGRRHPIDISAPAGQAVLLGKDTTWKEIKRPMVTVLREAFAEYSPNIQHVWALKREIMHPQSTVVLQKNTNEDIIGWAYAGPISHFDGKRKGDQETAYIGDIAIYPSYQRQGIVWQTVDTLIGSLQEQGYSHIEAHALNRNTWPQAIEKRYKDQIEKKESNKIGHYESVFFRIKI